MRKCEYCERLGIQTQVRGNYKHCRRCRLVVFAIEAEKVVAELPPRSRLSLPHPAGLTIEEYALLFESKIRELHKELVTCG